MDGLSNAGETIADIASDIWNCISKLLKNLWNSKGGKALISSLGALLGIAINYDDDNNNEITEWISIYEDDEDY